MKSSNVWMVSSLIMIAPYVSSDEQGPNRIESAMFFHSQIKDAGYGACEMTYSDGQLTFPKATSAPAISCPDAWAWKGFIEAVKGEFWVNWATDETIWPTDPVSLTNCKTVGWGGTSGGKPTGVGDFIEQASECPYYPADFYRGTSERPIANYKLDETAGHPNGPLSSVDAGRVIRQQESEIVYRNKPMFDYIKDNGLYYTEGLANAFSKASGESDSSPTRRRWGNSVQFPVDSVMFKVDWIPLPVMQQQGLIPEGSWKKGRPIPQPKQNPYITTLMPYQKNGDAGGPLTPYYLVSVTASSKAIPTWHWYAFEHVNNKGRCDFIGCNDSFGYLNANSGSDPANFISPHTMPDGLGDVIFDLGKAYMAEPLGGDLVALLATVGIGHGEAAFGNKPAPQQSAWLNYRLKGSQTTFTTNYGIPTVVGQSVTEGGFVNTSSCMTCHVQASVQASGEPANPGVGQSWFLSEIGYNNVFNGSPDPSWFFEAGTNDFSAVQTDFVWGILNANSCRKSHPGSTLCD
ncbi:hypothetical protein [Oceanobacter kriegii]|uniref:hypothetical protein n=1 Tax=Oceanobacter kriegii TaxID=64972 RepID=UPI0003F814E7|nr:hypothetical protein [Oceanobacter kriegii]